MPDISGGPAGRNVNSPLFCYPGQMVTANLFSLKLDKSF